MSLARGANYSQAGFHATLSDQYDVLDSVQILDATAGAEQQIYAGGAEDEHLKKRSWTPGFTLLQAGILLLAVVLAMVVIYQVRARQISRMALDVNRLNDSINSLAAENKELDFKIQLQNESTRIDYEALQVLGMVPQNETETYNITAPNPRPYEHKTGLSAAGH